MVIRHLTYGTPPENLNAILLKQIAPLVDPTASNKSIATTSEPTPKPVARRKLRPQVSTRKVVQINTPTPPKRVRARVRGRSRGRGGGHSQAYKPIRRRAPRKASQAKGKQAEPSSAACIGDSPKTAELKRLREEVVQVSKVNTPKTRDIKRLRQQLQRTKQQKEIEKAAAVIPPIAEAVTTNTDHKQEEGRHFALRNRMDATPKLGQRMIPAQHQFMLMAMTPGFLQGYMMGSFVQ